MSEKQVNPELQKLKSALAPSTPMNIIEQCRIVWEALQPTGDFPRANMRLAQYLGISPNKVYKMKAIHEKMIPEAKEWFKSTTYQMSTAYEVSALKAEVQKLVLAKLKEETGWGLPNATSSISS